MITKVEIRNGAITVSRAVGGPPFVTEFEELFYIEECDPYYADTGVIVMGIGGCGFGCEGTTQRYQFTVTE